MSFETTVLITGSKSGIGRGLLAAYALRPNTLVISAIRDDPESDPAKDLLSLRVGRGSKIIVAKWDAASHTSSIELVRFLQINHNINSLDLVVANAGIFKFYGLARDSPPEAMIEHFEINAVAPVLLYQAVRPLLLASKSSIPKLCMISSALGSVGLQDDYMMDMTAYGMSKAALNWVASRIHREEDRLVVFPVVPGWVQTAMGNKAAESVGLSSKDVPITLDESVRTLMILFDKADKTTYSGNFWDHTDVKLPW